MPKKISQLSTHTPVDANSIPIVDSVGSETKRVTWATVKSTLKTYFDTLYASLAGAVFTGAIQVTTIEVGHASDTTLSRSAGGTVAVEGNVLLTAAGIHAASGKTTPADSDEFGLLDSAASFAQKKLTFANLKIAVTPPPTLVDLMVALGSSVKAFALGLLPTQTTSNIALASQTLRLLAVYLPTPATITGVKWFQNTQGNYTGNNYNGVGLYSYSGGTLTLVASSTNDANIWKGGSGTLQTKAFSSPYAAAAGVYFVAMLYCQSAQTTAPAVGATSSMASTALSSFDFTNSAMLSATLSAQTALPTPQAASGLTSTTAMIFAALY